MQSKDDYTYCVKWSEEDQEFVGLCSDFPSLSWLASSRKKAIAGIVKLVEEVLIDVRREEDES